MSGLPNLQKLIGQATPGPWAWCENDHPPAPGYRFGGSQALHESGYAHDASDAALIAAAPALAELLIECGHSIADLLDYIGVDLDDEADTLASLDAPRNVVDARRLLARLADFDRGIA